MRFGDITGLNPQKATLIQSVKKNHVAHAQLFHGFQGSGNLALALAFGAYLNCRNPTETDSCGACASCSKIDKLAHPDVFFIFPTAGGKKVLSENFMNEWRSFARENVYGNLTDWLEKINIKQGNIPVEEARKLIQNLSLKSYEGGCKLVYIWLPEMLSIETANAILKVLEEPPSQTFFLLVCNDSQHLLATILSRVQRFVVPKFRDEDIEAFLAKSGQTENRAKEIALLVNGNLNKALKLSVSKNENEHEWFANWMRYCYAFNVMELVPMADEFDVFSKEHQKQVFEYSLSIFRELFLVASGNDSLVRLEAKEEEFVRKFSKVFKMDNLHKITQLVDEGIFHLERNVRAKIIFLDVSLQIAGLIK
ncbi:MAG: DNA polymerase-3 subunit delta' [Algoriphagus sp.]|jgi:DNA polymerase-3 subunit delta'